MSIKELKDKMTFFYLDMTDEFAIKYHLLHDTLVCVILACDERK